MKGYVGGLRKKEFRIKNKMDLEKGGEQSIIGLK